MDPISPVPAPRAAPAPRLPARRALLLCVGMLMLLSIGRHTGAVGLVGGLVLAVLPVPLYAALALWLDRFEKEPLPLLLRAFAWGALGAASIAMVLNAAVSLWTESDLINAVAAAPLIEEVAKAVALFFLFEARPHHFDNVTDGIVYAAMVGLGFATTENVLYYGEAVGGEELSWVLMLRGGAFPFAHPLFTAMVGIGLGLARERHPDRTPVLLPLLGLAAAVALHGAWNYAAGLEEAAFWRMYAGLMMPVFGCVLLVAGASLRREARVLREHLGAEVERGLLPAAELHCLCSVRARLRASISTLLQHGPGHWRRRHHFHQAASELAFHRWRVARGLVEPAGDHEAEYLDSLHAYLR